MTFVADRAENALYFRLYRKPGGSDIKSDAMEESDIIRVQLPEAEPVPLEGGRLSVIDDGLTQSRIIKHKRHSAHSDPLAKHGANITVLSVAPEHPSNMVELPDINPHDIDFALEGDVQPFVVNFIIHRKSSSEMPLADTDDLMDGRFIQCQFDGMESDLLIAMSKIDSSPGTGKVNWPPHSVVLRRMG